MQDKATEWVINGEASGHRSNVSSLETLFLKCRTVSISGLSVASLKDVDCNCFLLQQYLLTPWSRVLLEKLTGLQLVKKFPAFYGT